MMMTIDMDDRYSSIGYVVCTYVRINDDNDDETLYVNITSSIYGRTADNLYRGRDACVYRALIHHPIYIIIIIIH